MRPQDHIAEHIELFKQVIIDLRSHAQDPNQLNTRFSALLIGLKERPEYNQTIQTAIVELFNRYDGMNVLTQSGLNLENGPFSSIIGRLKENILPKYVASDDGRHLLRMLFDQPYDWKWLRKITQDNWNLLLQTLDLRSLFTHTSVHNRIVASIQWLSGQIAVIGSDHSILRKLPELNLSESPFLVQLEQWPMLKEALQADVMHPGVLDDFTRLIRNCRELLYKLRARRQEIGTSLRLIYATRNLELLITRLKDLISLIAPVGNEEFSVSTQRLLTDVVRGEAMRGKVFQNLQGNIEILAFEIVEHAAQRGGKYIATNVSEYFKYFRGAALGGLLIAVFALVKVIISGWDTSPLMDGLLSSMNYALCFVLVYLFGGIIATKQPAMTASTIARCMDRSDDGTIDDLQSLKNLIIQTSRSQFVSLAGNLAVAFPLAIFMASIVLPALPVEIVTDSKAQSLLFDGHPTKTPSIFYAVIAGVFLSLSGLISGYVDNKVIFNRFRERFIDHPKLHKWSFDKKKQTADYLAKNLGALSGNIALGFLLGMSGTIGYFTGLPLDIRHVAFSSANFGMGLGTSGMVIETGTLITLIFGVLLIGLVNFLVSFSITLLIALKSRKVTFQQTSDLAYMLLFRLVKTPLDFILPPEIWHRKRAVATRITKLSKF